MVEPPPNTPVRSFRLVQDGVYIARVMFNCNMSGSWGHYTKQSGDMTLGREYSIDPAALGVPEQTEICFHLVVVAGYDAEYPNPFIFDPQSQNVATFRSTGITLDNKLIFEGFG